MPTQPRTPATQYFEGAGNAYGVVGAEQHLNQVTAAELMRSPPKAGASALDGHAFPDVNGGIRAGQGAGGSTGDDEGRGGGGP